MKNSSFRYDINGLRAYAVILVVLFHFGITGFSAGFIGVDIFFVISGFLMTSIVIRSLEKGNFSILSFYLSRGIRIVPALFAVCVILLIIGWFFLLPMDYKALAKHSFSSINFISNVVYWKESGYFDTNSHNKALLHTWSLSVEWQFYILFPIIVALIYKIKPSRKFLLYFFALGILSSLILSFIITNKSPSAGFFLLPTRAWELLVGGLIFFIPKNKVPFKKSVELIGFLLIAISCYIFSINTLWPSYNAILPVLGAFFILLAHQQDSIFTKGRGFQWIGDKSYSIYLWHWPVVFFLHYFLKDDDYIYITLGLLLSVILGWLSYKFIETPTRKYLSSLTQLKSYIYWIIFVSILSVISILIFKLDGIKSRFSNEISSMSLTSQDVNPRKKECHGSPYDLNLLTCTYGSGPTALIVIGDSHADALLNGVFHALPKNRSLITYTISGCSTVIGLKRVDEYSFKCGEKVSKLSGILEEYSKDIPVLVINRINVIFNRESNGKPTYFITKPYNNINKEYIIEMQNAYLYTLKKLSKSRQVYITRPTPESDIDIPSLSAKVKLYNLPDDNLKIPLSEYINKNKEALYVQDIAEKKYGIHLIDISKFFCNKEFCHFTKNSMPLFFDDDHMSWNASLMLTPIFKKEIFGEN